MARETKEPFLTILTPTYKGGDRLLGVYNSLLNQTYKNFEWVIIMDGYCDETQAIINKMTAESIFPIISNWIDHNHKKAAHNDGVRRANGKFILIADDDDEFPSQSLEILVDAWNTLSHEEKKTFVGVTGLCVDEKGKIVGDKFPSNHFKSNALDCSLKHKIKGEKWGMLKTSILKKNLFFEEPKGYVGESTLWFKLARKYNTLYVNRVVRTYKWNENSIINSSLDKKKISNNCQAYAFGYRDPLVNHIDYAFYHPRFFAACIVNYTIYLFYAIKNGLYKDYLTPVAPPYLLLLIILFLPLTLLIFFKRNILVK